jgi:hypothetical protein
MDQAHGKESGGPLFDELLYKSKLLRANIKASRRACICEEKHEKNNKVVKHSCVEKIKLRRLEKRDRPPIRFALMQEWVKEQVRMERNIYERSIISSCRDGRRFVPTITSIVTLSNCWTKIIHRYEDH